MTDRNNSIWRAVWLMAGASPASRRERPLMHDDRHIKSVKDHVYSGSSATQVLLDSHAGPASINVTWLLTEESIKAMETWVAQARVDYESGRAVAAQVAGLDDHCRVLFRLVDGNPS